jgi:hypothetical protein
MDRQCPSCGGFCKKSGCERENVRPQREWVGLTKTEFKETVDGLEDLEDCWHAIEAKLKEKNCSVANNS